MARFPTTPATKRSNELEGQRLVRWLDAVSVLQLAHEVGYEHP
jgi:hypothetical protein